MKTIQIPLPPRSALALFEALEDQDDALAWQMVATAARRDCCILEVWIDGCSTAHEITLHADGSWTTTTHIEV